MTKLVSRMLWYSLLIAGGLALVILSCLNLLDSFWSGMGAALAAVGILRMIQIARYKKDADYAEKVSVTNHDERNRFLAEKARSYTFYFSILAEALGVIVLRIVDLPQYSTLMGFLICGQLVIYWVSWFVLNKKN